MAELHDGQGGATDEPNALALAPLRDLADLPTWLRDVARDLDATLDAASVDAGRAKALEGPIGAWLGVRSVALDGGRASPKTLLEWADTELPAIVDAKTARREHELLARLLPNESEGLADEEARKVAARIMAARDFVLTSALGAQMSDAMRRALGDALVDPKYGHSAPLRLRFLSVALRTAPAREIAAYEKRARLLFVPFRRLIAKASTVPVTPGLVAAAREACRAYEPGHPPAALDSPPDWLVFVVLALDGHRASAEALLTVVRTQEAVAERVRDPRLRCANVAAKIAALGKGTEFASAAKTLETIASSG